MFRQLFLFLRVVVAGLFFVNTLQASEDTIGPNGINSIGLGLDGTGIAIGQVEPNRPGKFGMDNAAMCCNDKIVPAGVFVLDATAGVNQDIGNHAMWVAGVMISKQTMVPPPPEPVRSPPIGVAMEADLYSSGFTVDLNDGQPEAAVAAQHLAKHLAESPTNIEVRAINMSFGLALDSSSTMLDGTSTLTQFIDWSASDQDVLYVVAGNTGAVAPGGPVPTDNFNGMTVAVSRKHDGDGVFRQVSLINDYSMAVDAVGPRTSTDILAPGINLDLAGPDGTFPEPPDNSGTSFAAPHVTGTVALLQQHAATQMASNSNARRHQVMKAVLLNSADKIQGILGMERTVLKKNGTDDWFDSNAHTDPNIPLDVEMGAGHLNANRAFQQFQPGETDPGAIPAIAWDYNFIDDPDNPTKYVFNQQLAAGSYVSLTLAWDRILALDEPIPPFDEYNSGDEFFDFGFNNLDLHLLPAGATNKNQAIASSTSSVENLEHIFASIPTTGNYEIWVELNDQTLFADADYALAWWAGAGASGTSQGDYNGDQVVNVQDYNVWRSNFGASIAAGTEADGNGNGVIDAADYVVWRNNLSAGAGSLTAVPEPSAAGLISLSVLLFLNRSARPREPKS